MSRGRKSVSARAGAARPKAVEFSGVVNLQFTRFLQSSMRTTNDGDQIFVGKIEGFFGPPPNGTAFETSVKLTVGAKFTDKAYEVVVHPALRALGAREEFRLAAYDYVHLAMSRMFGPDWQQVPNVTGINNVVILAGPLIAISFPTTGNGW